ncbi:MAG: tetratricopeptide repeat protein [Halofilum sp. (in: g-proteobacteria)]
MGITFSPSTGIGLYGDGPPHAIQAFSLLDGQVFDTERDQQILHLAHDWEEAQESDDDAARREAQKRVYAEYCASVLYATTVVKKSELKVTALKEVEDALVTYLSPAYLVARLTIAPLKEPEVWRKLAANAMSNGFAAAGQVLNEIYDVQPLIRRLAEHWIALPDHLFVSASVARDELWRSMVGSGALLRIARAADRKVVVKEFSTRAFSAKSASERAAMSKIGQELADVLFGPPPWVADDMPNEPEEWRDNEAVRTESGLAPYDAWQRALHEVAAVIRAVGEGNDRKAHKFFGELVDRQLRQDSTYEYVIKSICNIAQDSAVIFRTDFEKHCLERAMEIAPYDPWLLVQVGNHYKRTGRFDEANYYLRRAAEVGGDERVARAALADVLAQQGRWSEAIRSYKQIPGWDSDAAVRTAIADNLRRMGSLESAQSEYLALEAEGLGSDRTAAGRAEIFKQRGKLYEAIELYVSLVEQPDIEDRARWTYRMALAGILKQLGRFPRALEVTEGALQQYPFGMGARVLKASLLALMGDTRGAMEVLPDANRPRAFGEWVASFTHGLLLMRTARFPQARDELIENLGNSVAAEDEKLVLRLAAAVAFLGENDVEGVKSVLSNVHDIGDMYVSYMAVVLEYHNAILSEDAEVAKRLKQKLMEGKDDQPHLWEIIEELDKRNFREAVEKEIEGLLRMAA